MTYLKNQTAHQQLTQITHSQRRSIKGENWCGEGIIIAMTKALALAHRQTWICTLKISHGEEGDDKEKNV